MLKDFPRLSS